MIRHECEITGLGPVEIERTFQNNKFSVYSQKGPAFLSFSESTGEWVTEQYILTEKKDLFLDEAMTQELVREILSVEKWAEGIENWRKDALKRLEKSIPRLKMEYEYAVLKRLVLDSVQFVPTKKAQDN